ncbi:glutathione S-transferase L3-like isoform X1 [Daucus carota subsp. sativus]|uniref:glutathione S-transferase L3-like isoform X1 n=1 Tax=Daucus carota subsp. sativus TaxID=79200 RepID=UPI0007EEF785|nr:PREDICTED: glutathione S-transferase L3-like [Daucus carota subsp. sativus]
MAALSIYQHTALVSATSRNVCIDSVSPSSLKPSSRFYQNNLKIQSFPSSQHTLFSNYAPRRAVVSAVAANSVQEVLPPALDSTSEPPAIFDGTTRLYISYTCPYAQRTWITRNCKGLQDKIELVPIDLQNRPVWYKEKVYPPNKVPALEHNNEVKGESLNLIRYIDNNFEGPPLFPDDPVKKEFAEELLNYIDSFRKAVITFFKADEMSEAAAAFDYIETSLATYDDGPFFLGQFSLVDIAYAPFIERFQPFLLEFRQYDITKQRSKLAAWIEELNKIEGYTQTRRDPKEHVESYKKRFSVQI